MKIHVKCLFHVPALIAVLGLILTNPATAQTFTTLYSFTNSPDGADPLGDLFLSSNTLYGTTSQGGDLGVGMMFAVNTDGSGFTNLYSFPNDFSEGYNPLAGLVLSSNVLYGTTQYGANYPSDGGTVFAINTDGTGFTTMYGFSDYNDPYFINSDGGQPVAGMVLSGNTLYGTAQIGGVSGRGTVFAINTDGLGFTNL
jgi:uncharacterized repeat protein (TIGR03803 family)